MRLHLHQLLLLAAIVLTFTRNAAGRSIHVTRSPSVDQELKSYNDNKVGIPTGNVAGDVKPKYYHLLTRRGKGGGGRTKEEGEPSTGPGKPPNTGKGGSSKSGNGDEDTRDYEIDHSDPEITEPPKFPETFDFTQSWGRNIPDEKFQDIFPLTMAYFKEKNTPKEDQSVFYSGKNPNGDKQSFYQDAIDYAEAKGKMCFDSYFKTFDPRSPKEPFTGDDLIEQQKIESGAFARASQGKVFVYLPDEGVPFKNTWTEFEWPELVRNEKVTEILRINPNNVEDLQPIWRKGGKTDEFPINTAISKIILPVPA